MLGRKMDAAWKQAISEGLKRSSKIMRKGGESAGKKLLKAADSKVAKKNLSFKSRVKMAGAAFKVSSKANKVSSSLKKASKKVK